MLRARWALALVIFGLISASACRLPGVGCDDNADCDPSLWCYKTVCVTPCTSSAECDDGTTCAANGRCVAATDGGAPVDEDGGPLDAGTDAGPDAGPHDGGFDAGPCDSTQVLCDDQCVAAASTDAGLVPNTPQHCGACNTPAAVCVNGQAKTCSDDVPCPSVVDGTNECVDGECVLTCVLNFEECSPGTCASLLTLERCGSCDNDVSGIASSCDNGEPRCGDDPACLTDAGALQCAETASGGFACVDCTGDGDCPGGFCCAGQCFLDAERDAHCGCEAQVGATAGEDCTVRASEKVCVAGTCGCTTSGDGQCGSEGGLERLCDAVGNGGAGVCLAQDENNCGAVGGVFPSGEMTPIDGGMCAVNLGGPLCVDADMGFGECGCSQSADCERPILVDGIPRVAGDACAGDACMCGMGEACSTSAPDCAGLDGCVDLQTSTDHCGVPLNDCSLPTRGLLDGTGTCVSGGCQCDAPTDCVAPANVDVCQIAAGGGNACVCNGFTASGDKRACPMGLTCTLTGCEHDGTIYSTLEALNQALGL